MKKTDEKLITYQAPSDTPREPPFCRPRYETLDYILTPQRWKNTVLDCESDIKANINSDHFPLVAKIQLKLKALRNPKDKTTKVEYLECTEYNFNYYNEKLQTETKFGSNLLEWQNTLLEATEECIPSTTRFKNKAEPSDKTMKLLKKREENRLSAEYNSMIDKQLNKQVNKARKQDKQARILKTINKDLDLRDKWLGLRALKKNYTPFLIFSKTLTDIQSNQTKKRQN